MADLRVHREHYLAGLSEVDALSFANALAEMESICAVSVLAPALLRQLLARYPAMR